MKQREWMGYAAAVLAAGAFLTGCGNIRKLAKSDPEVGVHLPARSAQNPVAQAADTARTQKIITYRKQDGTELFITPVDVDSLSGEKMMSVAIDEVVISASNRRNLVERNGKINVEFVVSVPQELQARNWQLVVDPQLLKGADTLAFDPLVYSGDRFRTMQRREYARYDDYLGRIVDSADYFERFGDKRAYSRYMDRVVEQRTKYADAEARLERMTPEEAMFDRQVGWTTRGERRRQYARLRRYVTATDRKVRERTSYTPDASDKFDHLNDYFAPRYRHAYTGDDVLPGGGIYTRVQGEYPVDGGREREAYIRSLTENPGRVYGEVYTADDAGIRALAGRRLAYTGLRRPEVEGLLRETGDSAARENYRIRKEYAADRLAALNSLDTAEVRRGMLREGELRRNYERAVNSPAAFARLVRHPYYADARLDTVICRPDGRIDYYYTEQVQADENTSKLYLCLAGEVEDRSGRTYRITRSDTLTYNVASMTTFLDETTRYMQRIVLRDAEANARFFFTFPSGKSTLVDTLTANRRQIAAVRSLTRGLMTDPVYIIDSITLRATASPREPGRSTSGWPRTRRGAAPGARVGVPHAVRLASGVGQLYARRERTAGARQVCRGAASRPAEPAAHEVAGRGLGRTLPAGSCRHADRRQAGGAGHDEVGGQSRHPRMAYPDEISQGLRAYAPGDLPADARRGFPVQPPPPRHEAGYGLHDRGRCRVHACRGAAQKAAV